MRTRTLLIAAAALAAGIASSVAQSNVYSLNVVGYVNKTMTGGGRYTTVANPLQTTNNTLAGLGLITALPNSSSVLKWNTGIVDFDTYNKTLFGTWPPAASTVTLNPGEGILVKIPAGPNFTNTFVGEVLQGNLTNPLPLGYQMVGNMVPDSGVLNTVGLVPPNGSSVLKFDSSLGTVGDWVTYNKTIFGTWPSGEPTIDVAESIMVRAASAFNWVRNFTVQ
jgi:hypothetical protein